MISYVVHTYEKKESLDSVAKTLKIKFRKWQTIDSLRCDW